MGGCIHHARQQLPVGAHAIRNAVRARKRCSTCGSCGRGGSRICAARARRVSMAMTQRPRRVSSTLPGSVYLYILPISFLTRSNPSPHHLPHHTHAHTHTHTHTPDATQPTIASPLSHTHTPVTRPACCRMSTRVDPAGFVVHPRFSFIGCVCACVCACVCVCVCVCLCV